MQLRQRLTAKSPRLAAVIASILILIRRRELCLISFDGEDWLHRYRAGVIVETAPSGVSVSMLASQTREIFCHRYTPKARDVIVDLGAGVGGEVLEFSRLIGHSGMLVSVEAHPRTYKCLQKMVLANRLSQVQTLNCAASDTHRLVQIENGPDHISNRLLTTTESGFTVIGITLEEILEEAHVTTVDLLKINIEGMELAVLSSSIEILNRVRNVVVSCHDFLADQSGEDFLRTFDSVRQILIEAGYEISSRPLDQRPWIRNYLYGNRREI